MTPYPDKEWSMFTCTLVTATGGAVLIEYEGKRYWLPKSQIELDDAQPNLSNVAPETEIRIGAPNWLLREKEMI